MVLTVPVSVLKAKLHRYVREARSGETFIVTEWGKPVAVLGPLYRPLRDAAAIDHLTALGHAVPPAAPLTDTLMDAGQPTDLTGAIRKAFVAHRSFERVDPRDIRIRLQRTSFDLPKPAADEQDDWL